MSSCLPRSACNFDDLWVASTLSSAWSSPRLACSRASGCVRRSYPDRTSRSRSLVGTFIQSEFTVSQYVNFKELALSLSLKHVSWNDDLPQVILKLFSRGDLDLLLYDIKQLQRVIDVRSRTPICLSIYRVDLSKGREEVGRKIERMDVREWWLITLLCASHSMKMCMILFCSIM